MKKILLLCMCLLGVALAGEPNWKSLDSGLWLADISAPRQSPVGDSKITVVKINPRFYSLKLLSAVEHDSMNLTAREWCQKHKLTAAINAGMYGKDYRSHIGYMKNYSYVNNPSLRKDYKAVLAFNPKVAGVPEVQLLDLTCADFQSIRGKYNTFIQNLRMISCTRKNVWNPQLRRSSIACLGMDTAGNVLFIFSESTYSVYEFGEMLLQLPLQLTTTFYLEGGAPASLYLSSGKTQIERNGLYETGDKGQRSFALPHPLPHVIGLVKRKK
jgi:hypothetical protein